MTEKDTKECEICGEPISKKNPETTECPGCFRMRCENCDMGVGTVCYNCEEDED